MIPQIKLTSLVTGAVASAGAVALAQIQGIHITPDSLLSMGATVVLIGLAFGGLRSDMRSTREGMKNARDDMQKMTDQLSTLSTRLDQFSQRMAAAEVEINNLKDWRPRARRLRDSDDDAEGV